MKDMKKLERSTVVVITPLISKMRDQVKYLKEKGINAVQLGDEDDMKSLESDDECEVELIYGSAESFLQERWLKELRDGKLGKQLWPSLSMKSIQCLCGKDFG